MTWRERMALLLGAASPFAASGPASAALPPDVRLEEGAVDRALTIQPLEFWSDPAHAGHLLQLASHSSHRSHSSHSSHVSGSSGHSSHYSGSGVTLPTYSPPAPLYTPPPPPPRQAAPLAPLYNPAPVAPRPKAPATPSGSSRLSQDDISKFVQRVQIALMVKGYDPGPADGDLKPQTREALKAYQSASGLEASGNMDMPTLHALGVLK